MTFGENVLAFNRAMRIGFALPHGVEVLNPFTGEQATAACGAFYNKYYDDMRPRRFLLGINPGRRGAGVTGIPFTDPVQLEQACGIDNPFSKVPEFSSSFVYEVIKSWGGPASFYKTFYITSVFPLGFTRDGKNLNYYDDAQLLAACQHTLIRSLEKQLSFGLAGKSCYCLGAGKNLKILQSLNNRHGWFKNIIPLPHPRWVMQYRRKKLKEFIDLYVEKLGEGY